MPAREPPATCRLLSAGLGIQDAETSHAANSPLHLAQASFFDKSPVLRLPLTTSPGLGLSLSQQACSYVHSSVPVRSLLHVLQAPSTASMPSRPGPTGLAGCQDSRPGMAPTAAEETDWPAAVILGTQGLNQVPQARPPVHRTEGLHCPARDKGDPQTEQRQTSREWTGSKQCDKHAESQSRGWGPPPRGRHVCGFATGVYRIRPRPKGSGCHV